MECELALGCLTFTFLVSKYNHKLFEQTTFTRGSIGKTSPMQA